MLVVAASRALCGAMRCVRYRRMASVTDEKTVCRCETATTTTTTTTVTTATVTTTTTTTDEKTVCRCEKDAVDVSIRNDGGGGVV